MTDKARPSNELTEEYPAGWDGNTREFPYSQGGSIALDARDTASVPLSEAARLRKPDNKTEVFTADMRDSVCWRPQGAKNDEIIERFVYMRRLGSDESILPEPVVVKHPSIRAEFYAAVRSEGGFAETEFDPTTIFETTNHGDYVMGVEKGPVQSLLSDSLILPLNTSTNYTVRYNKKTGIQCTRERRYCPPGSGSVDAAEIERQLQQSILESDNIRDGHLAQIFKSETEAFEAGGVPTQHPEKIKTKKNTRVTFSEE